MNAVESSAKIEAVGKYRAALRRLRADVSVLHVLGHSTADIRALIAEARDALDVMAANAELVGRK